MVSFGKGKKNKNKDKAAADPQAVNAVEEPQTNSKKKKRKPDEMLASVVQESAPNAAIDLLKQNEPFVLPGEKSWVALALPVAKIGGLSKKQSKDEAKGSLIELIKADHVQALVTRSLLNEEILGIIPTEQSLERMSEYAMLSGDVGYYWIIVQEDKTTGGLQIDPVAEGTYKDAVDVSKGNRNLADLLPEVWAWAEGDQGVVPQASDADAAAEAQTSPDPDATVEMDSVDVPTPPEQAPDVPAAVEDGDQSAESSVSEGSSEANEDEPLGDIVAEPDDGVDYSQLDSEEPSGIIDDGEEDIDPFADNADDASGVPEEVADDDLYDDDYEGGEDENVDTYLQYVEDNRDREITEDEVRGNIARRFLSDDLDLTIPLDEFDSTFDASSPAIELDIADDPSDWLGSQVAQLSRQANAELALLRRQNVSKLRELFVQTMSRHIEAIIDETSQTREGSIYRRLKEAAEKDFDKLKSQADEEASKQRKELHDRFNEEADSRAKVAAEQARQVYKDRHGPDLNRREIEIGQEIDRRNEEVHNYNLQKLLESRKQAAHLKMDLGTTRALTLLGEHEEANRAAETDLLQKWNAEIMRFIDDNRKNDIARADALAEQLSRENQIDDLRQAHSRELEAMSQEHADRIRRLEAEMDRQNEKALAELKEKEAEWSYETRVTKEKLDSSNRANRELNETMANMDSTLRSQYTGTIDQLKSDKEASLAEMRHSLQVQSRANKILSMLVVVLAIAAVAVGIIVGWTIGHNGATATVVPVWTDAIGHLSGVDSLPWTDSGS